MTQPTAPRFTPVQTRILAVLADGLPHTRSELHACLVDELGPLSNIQCHISLIRKALHPLGEGIVCEIVHRKICYRHVKLLRSADRKP